MSLNISKGNMYDFVTHTWNTIKGRCPHDCSYCYMKRWGKLKETRLDRREFKTDLGKGNFIFVGSSCDMFARGGGIHDSWVVETLEHCMEYRENKYLFQSKNPGRMASFVRWLRTDMIVCTTLETNRWQPIAMGQAPWPSTRVEGMEMLNAFDRYVTIEPIMDFDIEPFVELIKRCEPTQVNIGADSGHNKLREPPLGKVLELIEELKKFTTVVRKRNLGRLLV